MKVQSSPPQTDRRYSDPISSRLRVLQDPPPCCSPPPVCLPIANKGLPLTQVWDSLSRRQRAPLLLTSLMLWHVMGCKSESSAGISEPLE